MGKSRSGTRRLGTSAVGRNGGRLGKIVVTAVGVDKLDQNKIVATSVGVDKVDMKKVVVATFWVDQKKVAAKAVGNGLTTVVGNGVGRMATKFI